MTISAVLVVPLLALALQETPGAGRPISAVRFEGAASLDRELLLSMLDFRPPRCRSLLLALPCALGTFGWAEAFDRLEDSAQLDRAAARVDSLYEHWGFPNASVSTRAVPSDGRVDVVFAIDEGRPTLVASVTVEGGDALDPPLEVPAALPLAPGRPYAIPLLAATERMLQQAAAERGYPWAQIEVGGDVDADGRARVVLRVLPGPMARFGRVQALTEPPLRPSSLAPYAAYAPGDTFRASALDRTVGQLRALPVVEQAAVQLRAQPGDTVVPTVMLVRPARVQGFGVEGTIASATCLSIYGLWQHRYVLGQPRVLTLRAGASNLFAAETGGFPCSGTGEGEFGRRDWTLDADLWQPALFGDPRTTLRIGVFTEQGSVPNAFIREGTGARLTLSRALSPTAALRLRWRPERGNRRAADVYFCANYDACSAPAFDALARNHWFAPVGIDFLLTSRIPPGPVLRPPEWWEVQPLPQSVEPWRFSVRAETDVSAGATGADYRYVRGTLDAALTRLIGRTAEIAGRIQLGAVAGRDIVPPDALLFPGGIGSIRGADQNLFGPVALVADSAGAAGCALQGEPCALPAINPARVRLRPLGVDRLLSGTIEGRLWLSDNVQLAGFVEAAFATRADAPPGMIAALAPDDASIVAPGIGLRLVSPVGPVRLDIAWDTRGSRELPLLRARDGRIDLIGTARYDPWRWDGAGGWTAFRRRLRLWLGIGQPF